MANIIKKIGARPHFVLSYEDKSGRMYTIEDDAIGSKAVPGIFLNGNPYDTSYFCKNEKSMFYGKGRDLLNFGEPFFGNGNDCYNPEVHAPYVFKMTYSNGVEKYHASDYAITLLNAIKENKLENCDVMGKSYGSLIALEALKQCLSNIKQDILINHVYAFNAPIYGSPLADAKLLQCELKNKENSLKSRIVIASALGTIAPTYGSTYDNAFGIELPSDCRRFSILGGSINDLKSKDIQTLLMKLSAEFIRTVSLMPSDGCVIVDEKRMARDGVNFIKLDNAYHSNLSNEIYMRQGYQKILEKKGMNTKVFNL